MERLILPTSQLWPITGHTNDMKILLLFLFLFPVATHAATFTASMSEQGDNNILTIYVSATSTPLNGVEGSLLLSSPEEVQDVYIGNSVITNWLEAPRLQDGEIRFAGIVSGGFMGNAAAGSGFTDPSPLFSIIYKGVPEGVIQDAALYLHNGEGTRVAVLNEALVIGSGVQVEAVEDRTAPEYIDVEILEDPLLYDGQRTLILTSFDAESGIDYFLVQEGKREWVEIDQFYVIQDSYGLDPIVIRAYDRAGNFLEKKLPGEHQNLLTLSLIGLLMLLALLGGYGFRVYLRKRRT